MGDRQLTPAQRREFERVNGGAFEDLRRQRAEFLRQLQAEGWSLRALAELFGARSHDSIKQWLDA